MIRWFLPLESNPVSSVVHWLVFPIKLCLYYVCHCNLASYLFVLPNCCFLSMRSKIYFRSEKKRSVYKEIRPLSPLHLTWITLVPWGAHQKKYNSITWRINIDFNRETLKYKVLWPTRFCSRKVPFHFWIWFKFRWQKMGFDKNYESYYFLDMLAKPWGGQWKNILWR